MTIFLNAERFLSETIESVLAQTFTDWEYIIVDDGSTDGSTEIAKRAAGKSEKIFYCEHPGHANRGMSAARNKGLSHCSGEFVSFIDADDVWVRRKLASQVELLDQEPEAAMVYGRGKAWYEWDESATCEDHYFDLGVSANKLVKPPELFELLMENKAQSPIPSNVMLRRSIIEEVGGYENSFRGLYEDYVLYSKIHLAYPSYVSDENWLLYRQHADSCTGGHDAFNYRTYSTKRVPFLHWLRGYMNSLPEVDERARQAFERELWWRERPWLDYFVKYAPKRIAELAGIGKGN